MKVLTTYIILSLICFTAGIYTTAFLTVNYSSPNFESSSDTLLVSDEKSKDLIEAIERLENLIEEQERKFSDTDRKLASIIMSLSKEQFHYLGADGIASNHSGDNRVIIENEGQVQYSEAQYSEVKYQDAAYYIEDQLLLGEWTDENAMYMYQESTKMSHDQRTKLQLKLVRAINDGSLVPDNIMAPLF